MRRRVTSPTTLVPVAARGGLARVVGYLEDVSLRLQDRTRRVRVVLEDRSAEHQDHVVSGELPGGALRDDARCP